MLPQEEFVEVQRTAANGAGRYRPSPAIWAATARRCGPTCRENAKAAGAARAGPDRFEKFEPYVGQRLADDPHLWGTALYDEAKQLGYPQSYPTFVRQLRNRALRPYCRACQGVKGQPTAQIEHPPGEEIQWDWLELGDTPWGRKACVLVGVLSHSGRFRAQLSARMDQAHLVRGIHQVLLGLGGNARRWRVDRMATVLVPGTNRIQPSFVGVAKHYSVAIDPCPPRRPNRKGASRERDQVHHPALVAQRGSQRSRPGPAEPGSVLPPGRRRASPSGWDGRRAGQCRTPAGTSQSPLSGGRVRTAQGRA